jgi:hypothetical protein
MGIFDMFKPRWKNSNPSVRMQAMKEIDLAQDQASFSEFLLSEQDAQVIQTGLDKIIDLSLCENLLTQATDNLQRLLKQKAETLSIQSLIEKTDASLSDADITRYTSHLGSVRVYENLATASKSEKVRRISLKKINKDSLWLTAAQQDVSEKLALEAVAELKGRETLEKVRQTHRHIVVGNLVRAEIQKFDEAERKAQEEHRIQQQVELIRSTFKRIQQDKNYGDRSNEIDQLSQEWQTLVSSGVQASDVQELVNEAREKVIQIRQEEAELKAREQAEQEAQQRAEQERIAQAEKLAQERAEQNQRRNESNQDSAESHNSYSENSQGDSQAPLLEGEDPRPQLIAQAKALSEEANFGGIQIKKIKESWKELGALAYRQDEIQQEWFAQIKAVEAILNDRRTHENKDYEEKSDRLKAIIQKALDIDADAAFEETSETLKNCVHEWKEIVGEEKRKYYSLWQEFKVATAPFQEMRQWEQWHNENEKSALCEQAEALKDVQDEDGLFQQLKDIREKWKAAGSISPEKHQLLWDRYKKATDEAQERLVGWLDRKKEERDTNYQTKTLLCDEMERLIDDENFAEAQVQFKEIQERWKKVGAVPKEYNDIIWERFKAISEKFYAKRKEAYEAVGAEREINLQKKLAILEKMSGLKEVNDWNEATKIMRRLHDDWKAIGPVPKQNAEELWNQFRSVNEAFYEERNAFFEELERQKQENLAVKVKLCEELESFAQVEFTQDTLLRVEQIKIEWKESGLIPKEDSDRLWERFCLGADVMLERQAETDTVLRQALSERLAKKQEIIKKAKELSESNEWGTTTIELKQLQDDWKNIGRVGPQDSELWKDFRQSCDDFFSRRRDQFEILEQHRINNLEQKQALIELAEKLAIEGYSESAVHEVRMLRGRWKEIGHVPKKDADRIWKKFQTACDAVFKNRPQQGEA